MKKTILSAITGTMMATSAFALDVNVGSTAFVIDGVSGSANGVSVSVNHEVDNAEFRGELASATAVINGGLSGNLDISKTSISAGYKFSDALSVGIESKSGEFTVRNAPVVHGFNPNGSLSATETTAYVAAEANGNLGKARIQINTEGDLTVRGELGNPEGFYGFIESTSYGSEDLDGLSQGTVGAGYRLKF